jgi:hypothetical protein
MSVDQGVAMAKKPPGKNRSANTGRYVKTAYAERNPDTTVTERSPRKSERK